MSFNSCVKDDVVPVWSGYRHCFRDDNNNIRNGHCNDDYDK